MMGVGHKIGVKDNKGVMWTRGEVFRIGTDGEHMVRVRMID